MRVPLAIAIKDATLMRRDMTAFFFTVIFPLIVGILFGMIFAGPATGSGPAEAMTLGVVDLDRSEFTADLTSALDATEEIEVKAFASEAEAEDAVRRGEIPAAVVLAQGMEDSLDDVFTGAPVKVECIADPSRGAETGILQGVLTQTMFAQLFKSIAKPERLHTSLEQARESLLTTEGVNPVQRALFDQMIRSAEGLIDQQIDQTDAGTDDEGASVGGAFEFNPVDIQVRKAQRETSGAEPSSSFEITIPQAAGWALLGCVTGFGASIVRERQSGTLDRLVLAPVGRWQVLAGKALGCFLTALAVQLLLFVIGIAFLGVRPDSYPLLALAIVCSCAGFVGVMMVLAVISGTSDGAEGLTRGALIVMAMLGGAGIPLAFMPGWLRVASGASPFKWVIVALEGAVWRDASLGEMLVPCAVLLAIGVVGVAIGSSRMKWER